jgi:hypothetical protein
VLLIPNIVIPDIDIPIIIKTTTIEYITLLALFEIKVPMSNTLSLYTTSHYFKLISTILSR